MVRISFNILSANCCICITISEAILSRSVPAIIAAAVDTILPCVNIIRGGSILRTRVLGIRDRISSLIPCRIDFAVRNVIVIEHSGVWVRPFHRVEDHLDSVAFLQLIFKLNILSAVSRYILECFFRISVRVENIGRSQRISLLILFKLLQNIEPIQGQGLIGADRQRNGLKNLSFF